MAHTAPPPEPSTPDLGGAAGRDADADTDRDQSGMEGLPRKFGKYTLIRKLAVGGMAELFLAIQRSVAGFEKLIVIKRILPAMNQDRAFIDMLLHEARIAATLSHPNIVQIFDVGQVDGTYFIAMEHVHGEDLRSIVRQMKKKGVNDFPLEHAIAIVQGMCGGLAYAHEKRDLDGTQLNIVHRDISPQNVVVTFTGDVKIVDFGIAKSDAKLYTDTKSGRLKGKVPYMSPEQARGDVIDWRSDIFAAGVMLFELTTGKRLFKGASEYETLKLICDREYPRPSQVREGYPPELETIVMRALEKDRENRYSSARQMQAELEELVRRERIPVSVIALTKFMQGLFEDKLAMQKQALLEGKQLADIIELQSAPESGDENGNRLSSSVLSTPAASRTVTDLKARSRRGLTVGIGAGVAIATAVGAVWALRPGASASTASAAENGARGSIVVTTEPPGAAIWINGDLRPEVSPATISQLPTGRPIEVKLTKDGFERVSEQLTLSEGAPSGDVTFALKRGSVSVDVSCKQGGADCGKVSLSLDGKVSQGTTLAGVTSGEPHKLVVSVPGFADQTFAFTGTPFEHRHFDVTVASGPSGGSESSGRRGASHASGGPSALPAPAPAGNGKLNVGATGGWCNVTVDGVARGATPVAGIELPVGMHRVTCAPADGKAQTATVTVTPDSTTRYRFALAP